MSVELTLPDDIIFLSVVEKIVYNKGDFYLVNIKLTDDVIALADDSADQIFYYDILDQDQRLLRRVPNYKNITYRGYCSNGIAVGDVIKIVNAKLEQNGRGANILGDIIVDTGEDDLGYSSIKDFCDFAGATFNIPHCKSATLSKILNKYRKSRGLDDVTALNVINNFVRLDDYRAFSEYFLEKFGTKKAIEQSEKIFKVWKEKLPDRNIIGPLIKSGLTFKTANKIFNEFGKDSLEVIKENPFVLMGIDGIGFKKADEIGLKNGMAMDDPNRLKNGAMAYYDMISDRDGHTRLPFDKSLNEILKELRLADSYKSKLLKAIDELSSEKRLALLLEHIGQNKESCFSSMLDARVENKISEAVKSINLNKVAGINFYKKTIHDILNVSSNDISLDDSQKEAVLSILNHNISCLVGGAGYGKTTVLKKFIECIEAMDLSYALCAPTGKASIRMQESTSRPCYTIHRAFGIFRADDREGCLEPSCSIDSYDYSDYDDCEEMPKKKMVPVGKLDWIIVDETSMLDLYVACKIFSTIKSDCRVLFVGDPNQLPPVGKGSVFYDLINSEKVNVCRLKFLHRTAGGNDINDVADAVLQGKGENLRLGSRRNLEFKNYFGKKTEALNEMIFEDACKKYLELIEAYGIKNVCVLTPSRKQTRKLSCTNFNLRIRDVLKPGIVWKYDVGDRIMGIKNTEYFVNGQVGTITCYEEIKDKDTKKIIQRIEVLFDGDEIPTDCSKMGFNAFDKHVDYAYASTVHKAQGSEYKHVIIILSASDDYLTNRNWLYTAITRARERVYLFGMDWVAKNCIERIMNSRNTLLQGLLNDRYSGFRLNFKNS